MRLPVIPVAVLASRYDGVTIWKAVLSWLEKKGPSWGPDMETAVRALHCSTGALLNWPDERDMRRILTEFQEATGFLEDIRL